MAEDAEANTGCKPLIRGPPAPAPPPPPPPLEKTRPIASGLGAQSTLRRYAACRATSAQANTNPLAFLLVQIALPA